MATADYWVVWNGTTATVSGPGAKPATPTGGRVYGPYNTNAEAQQGVALAEKSKGKGSASLGSALNAGLSAPSIAADLLDGGLNLTASGWSGWFIRGLKIVFGGILIVLAVSHLTGLDNAVTRTAGKILPLAAVAA